MNFEDLSENNAHINEEPSGDFTLRVNGKPEFVYRARVSAFPMNQIWPGYQRPLEQTEVASFAYWDIEDTVKVEITSSKPIQKVTIRPLSAGIKPVVEGGRIMFEATCPRHLTVEVNGKSNALHLFMNPCEDSSPAKSIDNARYYGPGIHHAGKIRMNSGETVFIDAGAIVHGAIEAKHASNIRILGRGILDTSMFSREEAEASISFYNCRDVVIDGIIIRDPNLWTIVLAACSNVGINNVKLIGLWRYNTDGIDIVNSQHVRIEKCFIRSFDDSIAIKGMKCWPWDKPGDVTENEDIHDVQVKDCTIWNDWGRALEIGAETCANRISKVSFIDCDIIHTTHIAMDIQHSDRAAICSVKYENIRIEMDEHLIRPVWQQFYEERFAPRKEDDFSPQLIYIGIIKGWWGQDGERGVLQDVLFSNISVKAAYKPVSIVHGFDASHKVENVMIRNLRINDKAISSLEEGNIRIGGFVDCLGIE